MSRSTVSTIGKRVPTEDDERLLRVLLQRFSQSEVLRQAGSARFKQDTFEQALRAQCFEPTLNVSGLQAGVVIEDGHKVIVPDEAVASIDIRPVAGMTVEGTMAGNSPPSRQSRLRGHHA